MRLRPLQWLSPAGRGARLSTFIFHRVLAEPDALLPDEPDTARFERIVAFLARHFTVLPLPVAATLLSDGRLPAAAACITFDDGYADNLEVAAPVLRRHGVTATFFIATGSIDGGRMWNDSVIEAVRAAPDGVFDAHAAGLGTYSISDAASRVRAIADILSSLKYMDHAQRSTVCDDMARRAGVPDRSALMLTRRQVVQLRDAGMEIGAHTVSHPILKSLDTAAAEREIAGGRETLAAWLGRPPEVFAYPNGVPDVDYTARDVELVRAAGFRCAVSTARGVSSRSSDLLQLPRFTPWDRTRLRFALRCAETLRWPRPTVARSDAPAMTPL